MKKYLLEIKNRLFLTAICATTFLIFSSLYKETLLFLLSESSFTNSEIPTANFIYTNVTEVFSIFVQIISSLTLHVFLLYLSYSFSTFLIPALTQKEYQILTTFLKMSATSLIFSSFFANNVLIPFSWDFFYSFQSFTTSNFINLRFEAKLSEYLNFYLSLHYMSIVYGQLVVTLFFVMQYLNAGNKNIRRFRKIYYYTFVILATLISPPDLISQLLISSMFILFYELFIFVFFLNRALTG